MGRGHSNRERVEERDALFVINEAKMCIVYIMWRKRCAPSLNCNNCYVFKLSTDCDFRVLCDVYVSKLLIYETLKLSDAM